MEFLTMNFTLTHLIITVLLVPALNAFIFPPTVRTIKLICKWLFNSECNQTACEYVGGIIAMAVLFGAMWMVYPLL